jgi:hypothetical protein
MKTIKVILFIEAISFLFFSCLTVPDTNDTVADNIVVEIDYIKIPYETLSDSLKSVNSAGNGFVFEAYFYGELGNRYYRFSDKPNSSYLGKESQWFKLNDAVNIEDLNQKIDMSTKYTIYIGIYYNKIDNNWMPLIDKIEGLISDEELLVLESQKKEAEIAQKALLEKKAKELAAGYVYHGQDEASTNAKLFETGALESGHAYYISAYMVDSTGAMGAAVTGIYSELKYYYVDYINQKIKGEVIIAAQKIGALILPVTVVVAGGKAPLYIPVILGLVK